MKKTVVTSTMVALAAFLVLAQGCKSPGAIAGSYVGNKAGNKIMNNEELADNPPEEWVISGKTTMKDIEEAYGNPWKKKEYGKANENVAWMYISGNEDRSMAYYIPGVNLVAGERKAEFYAFMFHFDKQGLVTKWRKEAYTEEQEGKWLDMESTRDSEVHE